MTSNPHILDTIRDEEWLSLFWESWHGSVGWILFKSPESFIEFVDKVLFAYYFPDSDNKDRKELSAILSDSNSLVLDRIKTFMSRLKDIFEDIPEHDTFQGPFTYNELVENKCLNDWFKDFLEEEGLPAMSLSSDHRLTEQFLTSIRDEPSVWPWEVDLLNS